MEIKPSTSAAGLALTPQRDQSAELRQAAEGFEEMFLVQFLKAARAASLGDDIMGSSAVEKTRDLFDAEIARNSANRTGLGIADAVERQFTPYIARNRGFD